MSFCHLVVRSGSVPRLSKLAENRCAPGGSAAPLRGKAPPFRPSVPTFPLRAVCSADGAEVGRGFPHGKAEPFRKASGQAAGHRSVPVRNLVKAGQRPITITRSPELQNRLHHSRHHRAPTSPATSSKWRFGFAGGVHHHGQRPEAVGVAAVGMLGVKTHVARRSHISASRS